MKPTTKTDWGSDPEPFYHLSSLNYQTILPRNHWNIVGRLHFCLLFAVPTVVQRHIRDLHDVSELTTYDTFFGRKASVVPYVLKALQPQELQQLCKILPEKGLLDSHDGNPSVCRGGGLHFLIELMFCLEFYRHSAHEELNE